MTINKTSLLVTFIVAVIIITAQSFVTETPTLKNTADPSPGCGVSIISKANGKKSHFFGLNCSACHAEDQQAKGCFTIAGSVLDEQRLKIYRNPVVKLFTEPMGAGKLVATIKGDALGNFYTTEAIDFGPGLYPVLYGTPGTAEPIKYMKVPLDKTMGQCNRCHGYRKAEEALGID